ncbi:MAG: D-TA family PLP-dependent enzyme [Bacteroidetes bacterium]|nr:D-TA family PLP-dependent enzyme [Bacteroidota bacterium]
MSTAPWHNQIDSPALVVFPEIVRHNIAEMVRMVGDPKRLRPHIKTHKTAEGIRMMMEAGIQKFKCATIAEAELLALEGAPDVLLAHQPVGQKPYRLLELMNRYPGTAFSTIVDDLPTAIAVGNCAQEHRATIGVYIDLNVGMNRTGIPPGDAAIALHRCIKEHPGLRFCGLHAYDGQHRHPDPLVREQACTAGFEAVRALSDQLVKRGYDCPMLVAGGSPTFSIHAKYADRECSPGTNIFWDHGYRTICREQAFTPAVHILTRVISKLAPNRICLDLGHKAVAAENEITKRIHFPDHSDLIPVGQSEEHLVLETTSAERYAVGDVLIGIPFHVCPTIALHESLIAVENGAITGEWQVVARKRRITI